MTIRITAGVGLLVIGLFGGRAAAQEVGPERGSLVIVGGGDLAGTGILERFLELAGGAAAPIVVIPTAGGQEEYDQQ